MKSKKAQSELITTVLIILLVLAAIIIVWQVVVGVLNQGKESVESQQGCIGFSMSVAAPASNTVNVIPNKDIDGYRVYVGGELQTCTGTGEGDNNDVTAMTSGTCTVTSMTAGDKITTAGKIKGTETWCPGANEATAP